MSDTASIARSVISDMNSADTSSADLATQNQGTEALADNRPDIIEAEVNSLIDSDDRPTARVAAVHTSRLDDRPWTLSAGMLRRDTPYVGTASVVRELLDLQASQEGREVSAADRRALAIERMVREHNASMMGDGNGPLPIGSQIAEQGSEQWRESLEAAFDRAIRDSQERRK